MLMSSHVHIVAVEEQAMDRRNLGHLPRKLVVDDSAVEENAIVLEATRSKRPVRIAGEIIEFVCIGAAVAV
jgi:hypothetical protein